MNKIQKTKAKSFGQLKVIQYPTSVTHTGHIQLTLDELKTKCGWKPHVVMIDYLGIVASSRVLLGSNSHFYLKSVAEELRAMGIKNDFAVWSAMQLNRTGMQSSDVEMTDIAESIGIPGVADFMLAATRNEEMDALGQMCYKQLKNRYKSMSYKPKFVLGTDFDKQLLLNISESQQNISPSMTNVDVNTGEIQKRFESNIRRRRAVTIDAGEYE